MKYSLTTSTRDTKNRNVPPLSDFFNRIISQNLFTHLLMKKVLIIAAAIILTIPNAFAQLDTTHWIPPLHARDNNNVDDHYVYLSTPITTPFVVTIRDGSGVILTTTTIANASPSVYIVGNGQVSGSPSFVPIDSLNKVLKKKGLILTANQPFYANLRVRSDPSQAECITAKGRAALGTTFRVGGFPQQMDDISRNFTAGIMATEPNTTVTISGYNTGVVFEGVPNVTLNTITVTLNQGECYVVAGNTSTAANLSGFIGALIQSNNPIILNNGNLLGTITSSATDGQDMGADQSVPVEKIGQDYILIEGNGNPSMEKPIVIAHYNNTQIFVNGNVVPITTINAGQFYIVPNSNYQGASHQNMYIHTSQPAYMYQSLAGDGDANNATGGLNFIPPFSCFLENTIDLIPSVQMIGATTYIGGVMIFTKQGATLQINGVVQAGAEPVIGAPWETYRVLGLTGNIKITSTAGVAAGIFGASGAAGYAGYFAGFSSIPEPTTFTYTDTCFSSPTNFNAIIDGANDSLSWNFGDIASGVNDTSSTVNPTHTYSAAGTYTVQLIVYRCINDTVTTTLTINPTTTSSQTFIECAGFSITVGANTYNTTGVYTDILTNAAGCDSTVSTNLTINQPTTSSQTFIECSGFSVTVGTNTYITTGIYTDVLTNAAGCDSTVSTNLTINPPTTSSQTFVDCTGFSVTVGANTYNTTGIYNDVLINAAGCDSTVSTNLTINPPTTSSQTFVDCQGFSVIVGTNTYNTTGFYTDVLTNAAGCDSTVSTTLTINQPTTSSQTFVGCTGFSIIVGTNTYNTTGTYTDVLTNAAGCDSTVSTNLTINPEPTAPMAGNNSPICIGSTLGLTSNTVAGAIYSWTGPDGFTSSAEDPTVSGNATIAMSGTYSITVTIAGCTSLPGTTSVIVNPLPANVNAGTDATILSGTFITLTASGGGTYLWSTGDTANSIIVSPTVTTDYCVTVMDANSCSDSNCVRITVEIPCGTLFIPLAFSPNADNENDVLKVYGNCITNLEFAIFDRWGEKVFESNDVNIGWDGTFKGKKLDPAIFVYYLKATIKGEAVRKHGNITLTK